MNPENHHATGKFNPATSVAVPTVAEAAQVMGTAYLEKAGVMPDAKRTGQHAEQVSNSLRAYATVFGQRICALAMVMNELCAHLKQEGFKDVDAKGHSLLFQVEATPTNQKNLPDAIQAFLRDRYHATGITSYPEKSTHRPTESCTVVWHDCVPEDSPQTTAMSATTTYRGHRNGAGKSRRKQP